MKRIPWSVPLAASVLTVCAIGAAQAAATGDLWEVTSQMTMEGMPAGMGMPSQTRQVCTAKEWTKPPVQNDRNCEFTDFQNSPAKTTWKMTCGGMTGEGEITRSSPDAYKGWMKMSMPQGAMTLNLTGRRVGDCDAGEAKKEREAQIAKIQAQGAAGEKMVGDAMKQICSMGAQTMDLPTFHTHEALCTGPQGGFTAATYKAPFCENAKSYEGFKTVCKRDPANMESGLDAVARFCDTTAAALSAAQCPEVKKAEDLDVLAKCCPAEAASYAAAHCAGIDYSSAGSMTGFCATFAKDLMGGSKPAAPPPAKKRTGKSGR